MTRILAVEPDPARGATLRRLLRDRMHVEMVLASSAEAAISEMVARPPQLVLLSSLLGPREEDRLTAHLRDTAAMRRVPVLTITPLVDAPSPARPAGLLDRLRRRRPLPGPPCDIDAVVARIRDALDESLSAPVFSPTDAQPAFTGPPVIVPAEAGVLTLLEQDLRAYCGAGPKRKRAQRWTRADLPWVRNVRFSWGPDIDLLNISRSGLLVESGLRLTPGTRTAFAFDGPNQDLIVHARVVRSLVASVDSLGVRYRSAAEFEQAFDALTVGDPSAELCEHSADQLAALVRSIQDSAARGVHAAELRAEFEAGVRDLVAADIRLCERAVAENDGRDSIYFTIPTHDGSHAVLQVSFEPHYQPQAAEFEALKAASIAAADVLQFAEPLRRILVPPSRPLAFPCVRRDDIMPAVERRAPISTRGLRRTA